MNVVYKLIFCIVLTNQTFGLRAHASLEALQSQLSVLKNRLHDLSVVLSTISKSNTESPATMVDSPGTSLPKPAPKKAAIIAKLVIAKKIPETATPKKPEIKTSYVCKPGELEGEIVILKPYTPAMFPEYFRHYTGQVQQGYSGRISADPIALKNWLHWKLTRLRILHYCIFDKISQEFVGEIEIRNDTGSGNFGVWLNENFWGRGMMKDAVKLIAREYFRRYPNILSFNSHVFSWNIKSLKGHLNVGFQPRGFSHDAVANLKNFIELNKLQPYDNRTTILNAIKSGTLIRLTLPEAL